MSEGVLLADEHPVDPDDELLVAYLDGELHDEDRKSVEKRLVAEADFQKRLQTLQTGWEWLDEMPGERDDEKLVESTLELVVADIAPKQTHSTGWLSRHARPIAMAGVVLLAFAIGIVAIFIGRRVALRNELIELAIAENHEAYKLHAPGNDFTLYYELAYSRDWNEMIATMERIGGRQLKTPSIISGIPLAQRDDALRELPTDVRKKLTTRWETYNSYDEPTKRRIRQTADLVAAQQNSDLLLETMKAAAIWIEGLGDDLRDQLHSSDPQERRRAINEAIGLTMAQLERDSGKILSAESSNRIYLYLQVLLRERLESNPWMKRQLDSARKKGRPVEWMEYGMLHYLIDEPRTQRRGGFSRFGPPGFSMFSGMGRPEEPPDEDQAENGDEPAGDESDADNSDDVDDTTQSRRSPRIAKFTDTEIDDIRSILTADELDSLTRFTELFSQYAGESAINETLRTWAAEAVRRNAPFVDIPQEDFVQQYRQRNDTDALDLSSPEEIRREVFDPFRFGDPRGGRSRSSRGNGN